MQNNANQMRVKLYSNALKYKVSHETEQMLTNTTIKIGDNWRY